MDLSDSELLLDCIESGVKVGCFSLVLCDYKRGIFIGDVGFRPVLNRFSGLLDKSESLLLNLSCLCFDSKYGKLGRNISDDTVFFEVKDWILTETFND